jgi:hypothetical protein
MKDSDQRRTKRHSIDLDARYHKLDTTAKDIYNLAIFNVSRGGFCFQTRENLIKDDAIEMLVELKPGEEMSLRLRIMWSQKMEAGLFLCGAKIIDGDTAVNRRLKQFCDAQLLNPPPFKRK